MKRKSEKLAEMRLVPIHAEVAAGSVVPFTPRTDMLPVALPVGYGEVGALEIRGISLEDDGIFDGDIVIYRKHFTHREIKSDTVCIVFIESTGELVAKKVLRNHEGMITLRSSGGGLKDVHHEQESIEVRGIVIWFMRKVAGREKFNAELGF